MEKAGKASPQEQGLLREEFFQKLETPYKRIKNMGGYIFHFVLPDNRSFLRMHNPKRYGDDLSKIRKSYSYVHKNKKAIFAFENGELICAFRHIYPLFNNKKEYIGAFEISYATPILQENLLSINKMHNHIILKKDIFTKHLYYSIEEILGYYIQSIEAKDYLFGIDSHKNHNALKFWEEKLIKPIKDKIANKLTFHKEFSIYTKKDDEIVVMSFLPIRSYQKEIQGYIVAYDKSENIKNLLVNNFVLNIAQFIALAGLFVFIYFLLKAKEFLKKEVKEKTSELELLNRNLQKIVLMEVEKNRENQRLILRQQKTAALGEMMDAIAHQWKQPLSTILLHMQTFNLQYELKKQIEDQDIKTLESSITKGIYYLLETIDEFRSFFRPNKELMKTNLDSVVGSIIDLMKSEFITNKIEIETQIDKNLELQCIPNELKHVFINMFHNAKDAFNINEIENRNIVVKGYETTNTIVVEIQDNAGRIPENIINNVFHSNFITKKQSGGTGIGLYLVKQILDKLLATVEVHNIDNGVCFKMVFAK